MINPLLSEREDKDGEKNVTKKSFSYCNIEIIYIYPFQNSLND